MKNTITIVIFCFSHSIFAQLSTVRSVNSSCNTNGNIYTLGEIFVGKHSGIVSIYNYVSSGTVSVEAIDELYEIKLFPNPTSGAFTITKKDGKTFNKLSLINQTGRERMLNAKDNIHDITDLPDGIYFICSDNKKLSKIIKKNK